MADDPRDRYLAALDEQLPMPPAQRAEVIEEINAHLDDAVADGIEGGMTADRAEADAQARLGPSGLLARELARPEQSAWRLLAAAGSGVRAGVGPWIYGYLAAVLVIFVAWYLLAAVVRMAAMVLDTGWTLQVSDGGWNTLLFGASAMAFALCYAGGAVARAVSVASRRPYEDVRLPVAAIGTLLAEAIFVLALDQQHNAASVVAMTLAPISFAIGVYRPNLLPRRFGASLFLIVGLLLLIPLGLLESASGDGDLAITRASAEDRLAAVGPQWVHEGVDSIASSGWTSDGRSVTVTWDLESAAPIIGLRDLRIEAWRADPDMIGRLDARWTEPFTVAAVERDGATLTGSVVTTREPGISGWELFLTGVGPDGRRYVVASGGGGTSTFTGSVWDWVVAVTD